MSEVDFVPRWASPPGDTIRDALDEQGRDRQWLAAALDVSDARLDTVLAGETPLTIRLAERLCGAIGGSVEFWIARDGQYRADQARVAADAWAQRMPLREMASFGWIDPARGGWLERIAACLQFFDVGTPEAWAAERRALAERARFRGSPTFEPDEIALAAWLRRCEVELSQVTCRVWDQDAFAALLPQLLPLTRQRDPQRFLPELQSRCADVGVAVGVVRAPSGCRVSGTARPLANGRPSIALSGRHLADDHLWFTFFHEAAHLLLHGTDAVYVDDLDDAAPEASDEAEADDYAGGLLVPATFEARLVRARTAPLVLQDIAREIGVSPGIVVGQLQHRGMLRYDTRFNRLKHRYRWNGTSLEMA